VAVERIARTMAAAELRGRDKGLRGASGAWLAVWVIAVSYRHLKKWTAPDPVVVRRRLEPGEQLVITHYAKGTEPPVPPKASRRQRRRAKRAASVERDRADDADVEQAVDTGRDG
jgi:hypothetical protein